MRYRHIVFDIDNTLIHTEYAVLLSLQKVIDDISSTHVPLSDLLFALGIPGEDALSKFDLPDKQAALILWEKYIREYDHTVHIFDGIPELLEKLKICGYQLGIITSKTRHEYQIEFESYPICQYFHHVVCADDTQRHKPDAQPMHHYLELSHASNAEILYIGDSIYDMQCAAAAGVDCGLAVWGCRSLQHIKATYYLNQPCEVFQLLTQLENSSVRTDSLKQSMELQFIAQTGLRYAKNKFDKERFERVMQLSVDLLK